MQPVFVLGFGRSGTTWISELISKFSGGLILFEPLHPCVAEFSEELTYRPIACRRESILMKSHLSGILAKQRREKWLLRGHIPVSLDHVPDNLVDLFWRECQVLGFKEIRANFMIDWLHSEFGARIVFIVRHPCAVIASIKNRVNFWGEFGWPKHYQMFLDRTVYNDLYRNHPIQYAIDTIEGASTDIEKQAVMWTITHAIALPELDRLGFPVFFYEDFSTKPFDAARTLVSYLGMAQKGIHPSFIFTSSKTSDKSGQTLFDENQRNRKNGSTFWADALSETETARIMRIVEAFEVGIYNAQGTVKQRSPASLATSA